MIATFVRDLDDGWQGSAKLYRLDPPIPYGFNWETDKPEKTTLYVVVSANNVFFSGPETYIFPADEDGELHSWSELEGSYRGGLDHEKALSGAGYEVAS